MNEQKIPVEAKIHLNKFVPRDYQLPVCNAIASEGGKYRKLLVINPRRSGKDYEFWALMIRAAIREIGLYLYCLPTFSQCRSVIWEGKTNSGRGFLDEIPPQLISRLRNDAMTINLINGSIIRLVGSDNYNRSIVGSNPKMIIFSEYSLCDENAYKLAALPIMKANGGIVALISTPRGRNHLFELYQIAKDSDDWFTQLLTIEDTNHISPEEIRKEIVSGEISESLALQEYYCSFQHGSEHAYYANYIQKMRLKGQIGSVPWEPYHPVFSAWDLGLKDSTVIILFQVIGETVRIIDFFEDADKPMNHFAQYIHRKKEEGYLFEKHFPPHDVMQRESARGLTKRELYAELGVNFTEPIFVEIEDGIEGVRRTFTKLWIDEGNCSKLIHHIENYEEKFNPKTKQYLGVPNHNKHSHAADALRYLCAALPKCKKGLSPEELDKRYQEAMYGDQSGLPRMFQDSKY